MPKYADVEFVIDENGNMEFDNDALSCEDMEKLLKSYFDVAKHTKTKKPHLKRKIKQKVKG